MAPEVVLPRLRRAADDDAAPLAAFAARAFHAGMVNATPPDDLAHYLAITFTPARLAATIADPARRVIVATDDDGAIAAWALAGTAEPPPLPLDAHAPVALERLYLDARWHGTGLAAALMAAVERYARDEARGDVLWLSVWEENARARRFYARHGFVDVGGADYLVGTDRQRDRILARRLVDTPPSPPSAGAPR